MSGELQLLLPQLPLRPGLICDIVSGVMHPGTAVYLRDPGTFTESGEPSAFIWIDGSARYTVAANLRPSLDDRLAVQWVIHLLAEACHSSGRHAWLQLRSWAHLTDEALRDTDKQQLVDFAWEMFPPQSTDEAP